MVIDDEPFNLAFMEGVLSSLECLYVECFADPMEALRYAKKNIQKIGLIFTDNQMPKLYGTEVIKRIRSFGEKKARKVPIVMISGEPPEIYKQQALDAGAQAYLTKPVTLGKISETL